jgi:hypothetical protein
MRMVASRNDLERGSTGEGGEAVPSTPKGSEGGDMVERVARAIANKRLGLAISEAAGGQGLAAGFPATEDDRSLARAAIAAMREPSEAMKRAHPDADTKEACYRAMIDAALADRSGG